MLKLTKTWHTHFNFLLKYFFVYRNNQRKKYIILYVIDHVKYNKVLGMQNRLKNLQRKKKKSSTKISLKTNFKYVAYLYLPHFSEVLVSFLRFDVILIYK